MNRRHKSPRLRALFNLAIDSKLRDCDLVNFWVDDIAEALFQAGSTISLSRVPRVQ